MTSQKRAPILISIPTQYVAISANPKASLPSPAHSWSSSDMDGDTSGASEVKRSGKKRRLDHLSWEEKVQRKKLKNRVAAQTSRDRKKAKMDDMEATIDALKEENTALRTNFKSLERENRGLRTQNDDLQRQLDELKRRMDEQDEALARVVKQELNTDVVGGVGNDGIAFKTGSAASKDVDPLQQGLPSTTNSTNTSKDSMWRVIALCLLYKICSLSLTKSEKESVGQATPPATKNPTSVNSKNWQNVCSQISLSKLQILLQEASTQLPRMQAPYHNALDQWWGPTQQSWNPPVKVEAQ